MTIAGHINGYKHQQSNFRKERRPPGSSEEIKGHPDAYSVCVHFFTLQGRLIRVGLIYGSHIPVSSGVA